MISLMAMSSDGEKEYEVIISRGVDQVSMTCSCLAGAFGTLCRHRIAILENKPKGVFPPDLPEFSEAVRVVSGSKEQKEFIVLSKLLTELKANFKAKEKELKTQLNNIF